ncbi:MAG: tripartite tricarboxylate transporter permease [Candidatus Nanoarchaeia archaeon]|nr:tripartite tricarboxylate transporter permease [Candidatus Nanoarchaeia archaeon]
MGILGSLIGAIIGLIPGLHCNLFAYLILLNNDLSVAVFLFCALLSSNIFEFLSAAYLNIPKEGEILLKDAFSKFLMNGRMSSAVKIIIYSSIITYSVAIIFTLIIGNFISFISNYLSNYSWILLLAISIIIIIKQKRWLIALSFFLASGLLGYVSFNINLNEPFLPLLTGMFGISSLIYGSSKNSAPSQLEKSVVESNFFDFFKISILGVFSSIFMMLVPAISPSQIGFFASNYKNDELKIASMASINIADVILSLTTFFYINKARNGTIEKIGQALTIGLKEYHLLIFFGFFALIFSCLIALKVNKKLGENIDLINSKYFKFGIIIFIILLTMFFDGIIGLFILTASTLLGFLLIKKNVRPINLMGSLALPTILFFIFRLF